MLILWFDLVFFGYASGGASALFVLSRLYCFVFTGFCVDNIILFCVCVYSLFYVYFACVFRYSMDFIFFCVGVSVCWWLLAALRFSPLLRVFLWAGRLICSGLLQWRAIHVWGVKLVPYPFVFLGFFLAVFWGLLRTFADGITETFYYGYFIFCVGAVPIARTTCSLPGRVGGRSRTAPRCAARRHYSASGYRLFT